MRARGGAPDGAQGSGARWLLEQLRTGCAHGSAPLRRQAERALMELLSALATAEVQARAEAARGAGAGCPSELRARRRGICHLTLGIGSRKALGSSPDRGGCAVHLAGPSARRHQTQAASSTRRVAAGQGCRSAPADGRRQVGDLSFERAPLSRRRTGRRAAARADAFDGRARAARGRGLCRDLSIGSRAHSCATQEWQLDRRHRRGAQGAPA